MILSVTTGLRTVHTSSFIIVSEDFNHRGRTVTASLLAVFSAFVGKQLSNFPTWSNCAFKLNIKQPSDYLGKNLDYLYFLCFTYFPFHFVCTCLASVSCVILAAVFVIAFSCVSHMLSVLPLSRQTITFLPAIVFSPLLYLICSVCFSSVLVRSFHVFLVSESVYSICSPSCILYFGL